MSRRRPPERPPPPFMRRRDGAGAPRARIAAMPSPRRFKTLLPAPGWLALFLLGAAPPLQAVEAAALLPCRLPGLESRALCGSVVRPLDPERPKGPTIDVHFAVLPALARHKKDDPVFFFAGGPGQSAINLAGAVAPLLARLSNRRDIVLIDQRGTGRSAALACDEVAPTRPLRESTDAQAQLVLLQQCRQRLQALPHGDLRQYTTTIAMQDTDAVRRALGAGRINLVGGSYGTRAALEYLRAYPAAVRRVVIDGVAPPDMALPASIGADAQAALEALLAWCAADPVCTARYPRLAEQWRTLLATLPRRVTLRHPVTLVEEPLELSADVVVTLARTALYSPVLASALPLAVAEAGQGRLQPLLGLAAALGGSGSRRMALAQGMHFSVVCSEDLPRMPAAAAGSAAAGGNTFSDQYRRVCADWPRGDVPAAFYTLPPAGAATLLLSGGLDPVTPPRHGARVARALGAKARHVVVPNAGHGVMSLPCLRDAIFRFVDADSDDAALALDADCARGVPRPPAFVLPAAAGGER